MAELTQEQKKTITDSVEKLRNLQSGVSGNRAKVLDQVSTDLAALASVEPPPVPQDGTQQTRLEREAAKAAAKKAAEDAPVPN